MYRTSRYLLSFLCLGLAIGCSSEPEISSSDDRSDALGTFEEFKSSLYCEPNDGACIVEGDIPVFGDDALREVYNRLNSRPGALTVHRENSVDAIWDRTQRHNLTYCVSEAFTPEDRAAILTAMEEATGDWEEHAHVDFVHVAEEDARCNINNENVLFDVSPAPTDEEYFARAFFPGGPRYQRQILVHVSLIQTSTLHVNQGGVMTMRGILRHELGHTLGFRHEHIRPESPGSAICNEGVDFRPITEYDARSTMHYPQCEGQGDWALELTEIDKKGARFFYPDFERFRGERCDVELQGDGELNLDCAPVLHEIVELANTAPFEILDSWVGLDVRAAQAIVDSRSASPFNTIEQLRGVNFLDKDGLRRLYDYLYVDGRCPEEVDNEGRVNILCRPVVHRVLELANNAELATLDNQEGASLDSRAAANIVAERGNKPFVEMVDLWAVSYVKERALKKMYDYLYPTLPPNLPTPRVIAPNSCEERCNTSSADQSCWCDPSCVQNGDCCEDALDFCPDLSS